MSGGDLPQVVGQNPHPNPGLRSIETAGQAAAYPALEGTDQSLASSSPALLDQLEILTIFK
jgi:hypothetical protein